MDITVVGAGHVGLVSAVCLAVVGHRVRVQDIDHSRIEGLGGGEAPFFEPGLDELLTRALQGGGLSFHADLAEALAGADLAFICVNTPNTPEGQVDLSALVSAARELVRRAEPGTVLVNRSTAPVGTAEYLGSIVDEEGGPALGLAVNPEFLSEGRAIRDFLMPDRVVIGAWDDAVVARILQAYEPILARQLPDGLPFDPEEGGVGPPERVPLVVTTPPSAELIKYAANAFLALKISFINEIAGIGEELGCDVTQVARGVGLDRRIGPQFLRAGIGWGGSCFPKDIVALQGMAETRGLSARMVRAANEVNAEQHRWVIRKLQRHLKTLVGRRVGLLGLAFKPNTDDLRNAPAVEIALGLARENVLVKAYDPAVKSLPPELAEVIALADDPLSLAQGADALVLVTEWPAFAELDLAALSTVMRQPLLLDGRNLFDPAAARSAGFTYVGVGR